MREDSEYYDEIESVMKYNGDFYRTRFSTSKDGDGYCDSIHRLVNYVKEQIERGSAQYHLDLGIRLGSIEAKIEKLENERVIHATLEQTHTTGPFSNPPPLYTPPTPPKGKE